MNCTKSFTLQLHQNSPIKIQNRGTAPSPDPSPHPVGTSILAPSALELSVPRLLFSGNDPWWIMILKDNIWILTRHFILVWCHVTFKLRLFHFWRTNFACCKESTRPAVSYGANARTEGRVRVCDLFSSSPEASMRRLYVDDCTSAVSRIHYAVRVKHSRLHLCRNLYNFCY